MQLTLNGLKNLKSAKLSSWNRANIGRCFYWKIWQTTDVRVSSGLVRALGANTRYSILNITGKLREKEFVENEVKILAASVLSQNTKSQRWSHQNFWLAQNQFLRRTFVMILFKDSALAQSYMHVYLKMETDLFSKSHSFFITSTNSSPV